MQTADDKELVRQYAATGSQEAFAEIVSRHLNMVFSVALRHVGNAHEAKEVTQAVFIILARKAHTLGRGTILSGWLFRTTRFTAANHLRTEIRRTRREQEAFMQYDSTSSGPQNPAHEMWREIAPVLDEAIASLGETDRNAIVLRFIEGRGLKQIGAALGVTEDGARMRLRRAMERLRIFFGKRGIMLSAAAVASTLAAYSVRAAPTGLSGSVVSYAMAGRTAPVVASALAKGTLKLMTWIKIKMAAAAGCGVILAAGTFTLAVEEIQGRPGSLGAFAPGPPTRTNVATMDPNTGVTWSLDPQVLARQPMIAIVRRSPIPKPPGARTGSINMQTKTGLRMIETQTSLTNVVAYALSLDEASRDRVILPADEQLRAYDYLDAALIGGRKSLENQLGQRFGLTVRRESRLADVLFLRVKPRNLPGLVQSANVRGGGATRGRAGIRASGATIAFLAALIEAEVGIPVIDQIQLTGKFNFDVKFGSEYSAEAIKQAVLDQAGLELVPAPSKLPITFIIVEKSKPEEKDKARE
jgi:uncharacterized protein (TIGR03435 family)